MSIEEKGASNPSYSKGIGPFQQGPTMFKEEKGVSDPSYSKGVRPFQQGAMMSREEKGASDLSGAPPTATSMAIFN